MGIENHSSRESFIKRHKKGAALSAAGIIIAAGGGNYAARATSGEAHHAPVVSTQVDKSQPQPDHHNEAQGRVNLAIEMMISEKAQEKAFLGYEIDVPPPPQDLIDTLNVAKEKGFDKFEAHYLPDMAIEQHAEYPGLKVKPNNWLYYNMEPGYTLTEDSKQLGGYWVLIDTTEKPNTAYDENYNFIQKYKNDKFAPMLAQFRNENKIPESDVPIGSRFEISFSELQTVVLPQIKKELNNTKGEVVLPKEIQINFLFNRNHTEFGDTNASEWTGDTLINTGGHLVAGNNNTENPQNHDGLGEAAQMNDARGGDIGFRPMIIFEN